MRTARGCELLEKGKVSRDRTHVKKNEGILGAAALSVGDPGAEVTEPNAKRLTPVRIARHVVARTRRISAGCERVVREGGEVREVFARYSLIFRIGINQGIVLIGLKSLLAASLAAEHNPTIGHGRRSQFCFGKLKNLRGNTVVHLGHYTGDVAGLCAFAQQKRQKASDAVLGSG